MLIADLDVIYIWSLENQLPLSLPKYVCLHYGFNCSHHKYVINEVMLQEANNCTDLGNMRSSDISYAAHVHSVCLKANRMCGMVLALFKIKTQEFKLKIFLTYIISVVEYAAPVWNSKLNVSLTARQE